MTQYFVDDLNYTLANEDTSIEYSLMPEQAKKVFSIGGSGARVLPLLAKNPDYLEVVDISKVQLYLVELRLAAAKALDYDEFLFFLGYRGGLQRGGNKGDHRRDLFERLKLSEECRDFWLKQQKKWAPKGFVLIGHWEGHFQKLGKIFRNVLRMDMTPIFEAQTLNEQIELYEKYFRPRVFRSFLRVFASDYVFNKFLYKGHFSGSKDDKTDQRAPWKMFEEEFHRIFTTTLVRKNYFFQVLFLGAVKYEEGLPLEAHQRIHEKLKTCTTQVNFTEGNLIDILQSQPWDFVSLSDTISYLNADEANQILQRLPEETPSGSRIVIRSFFRAPQAINATGWERERDKEEWSRKTDGTSIYQFHIFQKH